MSLTGRINALATRIGQEITLLREEMTGYLPKNNAAGGVLGGTYPNPGWAANVVFTGKALLNGLISLDGLDVRGTNNKFNVGSVVTLHDKTAGAVNPPSLVVDYSVSADLGDYLFATVGIHLDTDETNRHSAGRFFDFAQLHNNGKTYNWPMIGPFVGSTATKAQFIPYTMTRIQNATGVRTIVWGEEYMQNVPNQPTMWQLDGVYLRSYDDAPLLTDQPPTTKATPRKTNPFTFTLYAMGRCFTETGAGRAGEFATLNVSTPAGGAASGTLTRWTCEDAAGFVPVQTISNVPMTWANSGTANEVRGVFFGSSARMGFHGTNQDIWVIFANKGVYVYNATATARLTDLEFPVAPAVMRTAFAIGNVATGEFGGFRTVPSGDVIPMTRYTNISWPDTESATWWASHTWYDSVGTTHETNMAVPASITMKKRARLTVDVAPLPDPAAGAGQPRGVDDVNSFRLYLSRGTTTPVRTSFYRQTLQPPPLATTMTVTTNPVFTGTGLAPPATTNFAGEGPAVLQSSSISAYDNAPKLRMNAAGLAEFESIKVGGSVDNSLYGRAIDQLYFTLRAQATLQGGGRRSVTGSASSASLSWSQRFIVIAQGRGGHLASQGYFDVRMPTAGTVIPGVGGASNKTVTGSGVPLTNWDILWYELPFGSTSGTVNANFWVSNYTSDFVPPNDWIMIAAINGDGGFVQWGDTVKTAIPGVYDLTTLMPGTFISRVSSEIQVTGVDVPNGAGDWYAFRPPGHTVPAGARTCHALVHAKGSWDVNGACYWTLHNWIHGTVAWGRAHNHAYAHTVADLPLFAIVPVTPGQTFQCDVIVNNDPASGILHLGWSYYSYTFMS